MNVVRTKNPEKEYPSNMGQKWTDEEETLMLEELNKNIDIKTISQNHNRTIGGITSRLRDIAYKMHLKNISIEEIIKQTKLDEMCIRHTIEKKQSNTPKKIEIKKQISIENEIVEMKNDIKELKFSIKELVEMMKAVYEFENVQDNTSK
jgi:hypothetical protein